MTINRFDDALYTPTEVARYLGVPAETVRRWTQRMTLTHSPGRRPTVSQPVVTARPASHGHARVPFIGLAEAYTLAAFRDSGVPLRRIRPALAALDAEMGLSHALASEALFTDGAEVLVKVADETGSGAREAAGSLVVIRNGQRVFTDVVQSYLRKVDFEDGYAQVIPLLGYGRAEVIADPRRGFGQPVFAVSGARLSDAMALFEAGEPLSTVSGEFGLPMEQLEDAVRASMRTAA